MSQAANSQAKAEALVAEYERHVMAAAAAMTTARRKAQDVAARQTRDSLRMFGWDVAPDYGTGHYTLVAR